MSTPLLKREVDFPQWRLPLIPLVALLLIGGALAYLFSNETPRGRVAGITVLRDAQDRPLAGTDVYLTPKKADDDNDEDTEEPGIVRDVRHSRHVVTRADGTFEITSVPTGSYSLSASARSHSSKDVPVQVEEARTVNQTLALTRTEPDLSIGSHQITFGTAEKPYLPLKGYVDAAASGKDGLTVRIWKTRLSDILRRDGGRDALDTLGADYGDPVKQMPPALVADNKPLSETAEPIKNADREGFFLNRVTLPPAMGHPGLYLAEFTHGKKTVCSYILVSDMGLVSKRADNQIVAYAVNLKTGVPLPNAAVHFYRSGQVAATNTTGADGIARLNVPPLPTPPKSADDDSEESSAPQEKDPLVAATRGDDEAVVQRANWWYGGESKGYAVHIVTDRTIYRPGDTIQFKGIVRQRSSGNANGYTVPRNVPVQIEIRDLQGALISKTNAVTNATGSFSGSVETSAEGATGPYTLISRIGGPEGEKHMSSVMVASYRKPEYRVTVTPGKAHYIRGDDAEMTIEGTYYFGTPVAGGKVHYSVYREADWVSEYGLSDPDFDPEDFHPEEYSGYHSYYGSSVVEGEATLDSNGKAVVRFSTKPKKDDDTDKDDDQKKKPDAEEESGPQAEKFTLTANVEDDTKRSVEAEGAVSVTAADLLLRVSPEGYLAAPGRASTILVTAQDFDGKPLPGKSISLHAEYWDWNKVKKERVKTALPGLAPQTTGADGRAVFTLTPARNGELTLKATATDSGGHTARESSSLWVTDDNGGDLDTDYADLTLLTDKKRYEPGETARILINSARTGQAVLLTVEGERVYEARTIPISQRSTVVTLPIKAEWGANAVLAACYVRDKKFASSETPLRVTQKAREIMVGVKPDRDTVGPGETVVYAITTTDAATGKPVPADFSLGVVDESIFALRADDPKALKRSFYPHRSNQVSTAYSFRVEYLGDADKSEPQIEARHKFRDTAFWEANLQTDATGKATVKVPLMDNLTTWRATVQAVTERTAVGYGVSKIVSTKPFFVRLEMPRYLTGGDETRLLALAHNETGQPQNVTLHLSMKDKGNELAFGDSETKTLTIPAGGIGQAEWPVKVANPGEAHLRLTGWTPSAGAGKQYTDGIETTLTVRAYGRTDVGTFAGSLGPDSPQVATITGGVPLNAPGQITLTLDPAAVPAETRLNLRVTPSVRGALSSGLDYLIGFPYGCTEQTMSRFYPDLLADRLKVPLPATKTQKLPKMVRDGLARLRRFQHSSGAWGWWENDPDNSFLTAYVLTGLATARDSGYPVDEVILKRGSDAGVKMLDSATPREKPFLLYALALAGQTDVQRLRYPFRYSTVRTKLDLNKLPPDALAYLVLLAKRIGEDYRPAWNELQRRARVEGRLIHWTTPNRWDDGGSDRMATAAALRAMLAINPQDTRMASVLRWLMASRTDSYFGNTRDTSWVLTALSEYLALHPEEKAAPAGRLTIRINGKSVQTLDLAATTEPEIAVTLPTDALHAGSNTFEMLPEGGATSTLFYALTFRQTVATANNAALPEVVSDGVTVKREIVRVLPEKVGTDGWRLGVEDTKNRFKQGDRLRVRLTITAKEAASYVLIEDRFPSGCEISQRGTEEEVVESWGYWYDHVDVRDDRIAFFARNLPKGTQVIEYNLRAQTPGVSSALPTQIQGMYDARLRSESASDRVEVTK